MTVKKTVRVKEVERRFRIRNTKTNRVLWNVTLYGSRGRKLQKARGHWRDADEGIFEAEEYIDSTLYRVSTWDGQHLLKDCIFEQAEVTTLETNIQKTTDTMYSDTTVCSTIIKMEAPMMTLAEKVYDEREKRIIERLKGI